VTQDTQVQVEGESQSEVAEAVEKPERDLMEPVEGEQEVEQEPGVAEGAEEAVAEEVPDELEQLRAELEEARARAAEYLDGWQRTQAEFSNYKKRLEAERSQMVALANVDLLRKLLPVADDLGRAVRTLPDGPEGAVWLEGLLLIKRKLDALLESEGVERIESEGQLFDPRFHEAVTHEAVEGYEEGQIIGEVQPGYKLGERVLQPALVRVAKGAAVQRDEEGGVTETEES